MNQTLFMLRKYLAMKRDIKEFRSQMLIHAVNDLGLPQDVAKQINLEDFFNGYVSAQGYFEDKE